MVGVDRFLVRQWLDGCVVFDRHFGDTHALDPSACAIFLASANGPTDRLMLIMAIRSLFPEKTDTDLASQVEEVLDHLQKLGLAETNNN